MIFDPQLRAGDVETIAALRRQWATLDGHDTHGIESQLPTDNQLASDLTAAAATVVARSAEEIRGYGRLLSWTETTGLRVHLLDTYSAPGAGRALTDEGLLTHLEERAGAEHHSGTAVVGANADVTDLERVAVLNKLGYALHFEMVELELRERTARREPPTGVTIRSARRQDAAAIARLTEHNWAGRSHFGGLSVGSISSWLDRNDPALFLLAEADGELVGIAVGNVTDRFVEIEDLGVRPSWRRRGLALGLMTELLDRIGARSTLPVRLLTEGHDPAGARSLYERLGFVTAARHGRYRKPMSAEGD